MAIFQETIKKAYESGDLTQNRILRKAMMYENLTNCPDPISQGLAGLPDWSGLDSDSDCPGADISDPGISASVPSGPDYSPRSDLHHVMQARYILKMSELTQTTITKLRDQGSSAEQRVRTFIDDVLPYYSWRPEFSWLFLENDRVPDDSVALLQDLGLFHYGKMSSDDAVIRFRFAAQQCQKPHWGNADLAFFFRQTSDDEPHGWSLSLRTGEPAFPEMISSNIWGLEMLDVVLEDLGIDCNLSEPPPLYWDIQRKRIDGQRQ